MSPGDIAMSQRGDIAMSPDPSLNHHGDVRQRATRVSPPRSEKKETTPIAIIQTLADVCVIDRSIATKKDHIILADAAGALYQAGKRQEQTDEQIADVISGFPKWFKTGDFRGQKGEAPTPDLVRRLWKQYIEWRKKGKGHSSGPIVATKPNIAPDALSREELAEAAKRYRNGTTPRTTTE